MLSGRAMRSNRDWFRRRSFSSSCPINYQVERSSAWQSRARLVNNPKLILADEPTGNLDSKTGEIVLETFRQLNKKQGRTVILITHDADVAGHAERVILIKDGKIVSDRSTNKHHIKIS